MAIDTETITYHFTADESVVAFDVTIAAHRLHLLATVPASEELPIAVSSGWDDIGHWVAIDADDAPTLRAMIETALEVRASMLARLAG